MKKFIVILLGLLPILSLGAFARPQTVLMGKDEARFSFNGGIFAHSAGYDLGKEGERGYTLKGLGGDVGFSHFLGHDLEYSLDLAAAYSTNLRGKLFDDTIANGFRGTITLSARYLPQLAESFRLGAILDIGYGRLFGGANKAYYDAYSFGDMFFNVGPAFTHHATESFSWGMGLTYGLSDMRFGGKDIHEKVKQYSNLHTLRLPLDFIIEASEQLRVIIGLDSGWRYLGENHKFHHGIYNELSLGLVYGI